MIKYKLICKNCDFSFDSWFASSKEYEKLKSKKFLNCHKCNSQKVEKTLMAPQLINRNKIGNLEKKSTKLTKARSTRKTKAISNTETSRNLGKEEKVSNADNKSIKSETDEKKKTRRRGWWSKDS